MDIGFNEETNCRLTLDLRPLYCPRELPLVLPHNPIGMLGVDWGLYAAQMA
jgi:hypothetical protein